MLSPKLGGIEQMFLYDTRALIEQNWRVTAIIHPRAKIADKIPENVEIIRLNSTKLWWPPTILQQRKLLAAEKPDVIFSHGARARRWAAAFWKIPHVIMLHRHRYKGIAKATRILCVNRTMMIEAKQQGIPEDKLIYFPNFLPEIPAEIVSKTPAKIPVIGFLGRLKPEKGADILLEAVALLRARNVEVKILLAGSGPEEQALRALCQKLQLQDYVQFLGWCDNVEENFFPKIDLLCVPSRWESFGLVILQSFACSVPVVATNSAGAQDLIAHEKNGWLSNANPEALAERLSQALSNVENWPGIISTAFAEVEKFTMAKQGARLSKILLSASKRTYSVFAVAE
jgi:glycosyltransferase involved in cell wall biosynthesis